MLRDARLEELEAFWLGQSYDRIVQEAGVPSRVNKDVVQLLVILAREIRDLRQALLQQAGSRPEGEATGILAGGGR